MICVKIHYFSFRSNRNIKKSSKVEDKLKTYINIKKKFVKQISTKLLFLLISCKFLHHLAPEPERKKQKTIGKMPFSSTSLSIFAGEDQCLRVIVCEGGGNELLIHIDKISYFKFYAKFVSF